MYVGRVLLVVALLASLIFVASGHWMLAVIVDAILVAIFLTIARWYGKAVFGSYKGRTPH